MNTCLKRCRVCAYKEPQASKRQRRGSATTCDCDRDSHYTAHHCLNTVKSITFNKKLCMKQLGMTSMGNMSSLQICHTVCVEPWCFSGSPRPGSLLRVCLCTLALGDIIGRCHCFHQASGNSLGSMSNVTISKWAKKAFCL